VLGVVAGCLPVCWLDCAYDQVARRRHRFAGPAACTRLSPYDLAE
jgi:predicted DCC family thiol-disulfide oxidoreductase YuxK